MMDTNPNDGICWQYKRKLDTISDDLNDNRELINATLNNIIISYENKNDVYTEVKEFIEKYEWLGKISLYPSHIFTARYKGLLCGVVVMDTPITYSKLLGDNTHKIERLISRGASSSWSPKNLSSKLIMYSIKWMVRNTEYRIFSAYCDPMAYELGTIYQSCNFYYLGNKFGSKYQYNVDGKWISDRSFRNRSVYKRLAIENGIQWDSSWQYKSSVLFKNMPKDIANKLRKLSKDYQLSCNKREIKQKHKYVYVLGRNKKETRMLRKEFELNNKIYPYPKLRGE